MRGYSIAALCALALLAACQEEPITYTPPSTVASAPAAPQGVVAAGSAPCSDASVTPDGRLRCTFSDGRGFDGQVRNGKANGQGEMSFPNGARFSGTFVDGLFGGRGIYWYQSGARYDGEFANGLRNGEGTTVWPDGARYTGGYRDNKPNGYGTTWTKSGTHSGIWVNGCLASARIAIDNTLAECGFQ